jgi:hypothetical protein
MEDGRWKRPAGSEAAEAATGNEGGDGKWKMEKARRDLGG